MASPRIFISSTFYDLRQVRADLERAIKELAYEPILAERGNIPYGSEEKLEEYCYKEIGLSDIVVAIVGGRFGSGSDERPYSISQMELKTAVDLGKPVYIFVDQSVLSEYSTYRANRDVEGINYRFVDDTRVYEFLSEVDELPANNPIAPFETAQDIVRFLKQQWAGLFQRFLQEQEQIREARLLEDLRSTAETLDQLVDFLTEERKDQDQAIRDILLRNHPAFHRLKKLTSTSYRVFFMNREEMASWLAARGYQELPAHQWDSPEFSEWLNNTQKRTEYLLRIRNSIFDEDKKLKVYTVEEWDDAWIQLEEIEEEPDFNDELLSGSDDLPF